MNTIKLIVLIISITTVACATDTVEPEPMPEPEPTQCESSTLPGTEDEWAACRENNVDSWPVFCEGDAMPTACDFAVDLNGAMVICRPAGGCSGSN